MAPAVAGTRRTRAAAAQPEVMTMAETAERLRAHIAANFTDVGDAFAREARAMHEGERPRKGIYGRATPDEVRALAEDGVPVAPLPAALTPRRPEGLN